MCRWHFEHFLSGKASELAGRHPAIVHCNTVFDTMLDPEMLAAGHANPRTGRIGIQSPWCDRLMAYLRHPGQASAEEIWSLNMFTHESMHVRGECGQSPAARVARHAHRAHRHRPGRAAPPLAGR